MVDNSFSIIIPVLNESECIHRTLEMLFALQPVPDEIIVVDGNPSGSTIKTIVQTHVKKLIAKTGRGTQMNFGACHASGNILIFLHADTTLPTPALTLIQAEFDNPSIVAGAFDLGIASSRPVYRLIERAASFRSRLTRVPYGDQAIFMKRDMFIHLGGFHELPLMEDIELMRRIKRRGQRIKIIPHRVLTSPRRWEKEGVCYGTLRNWSLAILYLLGISPATLKRFY